LEFKSIEKPTITVLPVDRKQESDAESVAPESVKEEDSAVDPSEVASHLTGDDTGQRNLRKNRRLRLKWRLIQQQGLLEIPQRESIGGEI